MSYDDTEFFAKKEQELLETQDWPGLSALYDEGINQSLDPERRAELLVKSARLREKLSAESTREPAALEHRAEDRDAPEEVLQRLERTRMPRRELEAELAIFDVRLEALQLRSEQLRLQRGLPTASNDDVAALAAPAPEASALWRGLFVMLVAGAVALSNFVASHNGTEAGIIGAVALVVGLVTIRRLP